jgi:hypothetical protein
MCGRVEYNAASVGPRYTGSQQGNPGSGYGGGQVLEALHRLHKIRFIDPIDGPYIDRQLGAVEAEEKVDLELVSAEEHALNLWAV